MLPKRNSALRPQQERPLPLQIVKRPDREHDDGHDDGAGSSRTCSSSSSMETTGAAAESAAANTRQLLVPKRRLNGGCERLRHHCSVTNLQDMARAAGRTAGPGARGACALSAVRRSNRVVDTIQLQQEPGSNGTGTGYPNGDVQVRPLSVAPYGRPMGSHNLHWTNMLDPAREAGEVPRARSAYPQNRPNEDADFLQRGLEHPDAPISPLQLRFDDADSYEPLCSALTLQEAERDNQEPTHGSLLLLGIKITPETRTVDCVENAI